LALAGFVTSGQLTAEIVADPESLARLRQRSNWPNAADGDAMARMRDLTQYVFGTLLAFIAGIYVFRRWRSRANAGVAVTYRDGPTFEATGGMTLLELSRASGVPHASVCGGRARCFTCRVKIESGLENLPAPQLAETVALRALEAPKNVRLACQLRPTAPMTVTILNRPAVPGPVQVEFIEVKSVVAAHTRALLGDETVDIRSDDPDELTHWFAHKIEYPVVVPDLKGHRFSLYGGRVDYLENQAVATLALGQDERAISLYVMPPSDAEAVRGNRNGYSVVGWEDAYLAYFAVSDLDREVLDELQDAVSEANRGRIALLRTADQDVSGPEDEQVARLTGERDPGNATRADDNANR
jgi:ferredoxin